MDCGVIGAGSNRMNLYTVGMATQGFANYIKEQGKDAMNRGVVIAYDSRRMSREFAERVALVLNGNELRPSCTVNFSLPHIILSKGCNCRGGYNRQPQPAEYNGYKVYWEDGAQITLGEPTI